MQGFVEKHKSLSLATSGKEKGCLLFGLFAVLGTGPQGLTCAGPALHHQPAPNPRVFHYWLHRKTSQQRQCSVGMHAHPEAGLPAGRHPGKARNIQAFPKIATNSQTCPENPVTSIHVQKRTDTSRSVRHVVGKDICMGIFKHPLSWCFQSFPDTISLQPPLGSNSKETRPEKAGHCPPFPKNGNKTTDPVSAIFPGQNHQIPS